MAYIVPQVQVFQAFQAAVVAIEVQLPACVFGPNYKPFRYDVAEEKLLVGIGEYDPAAGNIAAWPNKPAGGVVDQNWTRLFMDEAWLQYYRSYGATEIKAIEGYANRIRATSLNFADYESWDRSAPFGSRDVQVGDGVILRGSLGGSSYEFQSLVVGLAHDVIAASIGSPTSDPYNAGSQAAASSTTQTVGPMATVNAVEDGTAYDGSVDGDLSDSYYLECTVGGDFGTARLRVTNGSGHDPVAEELVPLDGVPLAVGTRGLTVTFSTSGSAEPFTVGQTWRIDVAQDWTASVAALGVGGEYNGASAGTYVLTVVRGGKWTNPSKPQVYVTSTGTLDTSGPYDISDATDIVLPTGVKIQWNGGSTGLSKNDRYYVVVNPAMPGAIKTITVQNSLPEWVFGQLSDSDPVNPINLDLALSIVKNIEVPRVRTGILQNFTTSSTQITVNPSIYSYDSSWVNGSGVEIALPVIMAEMYVQYRALIQTWTAELGEVSDISEIEDALGVISTDNPLAYGVAKAVTNSGGSPVKFMATNGTNLSAFNAVLEAIYDREDVYGLVPLTHDRTIQDAVVSHCNTASTSTRNRWRVCWFNGVGEAYRAVETRDESGEILYGTILDDPDTAGTQYTRFRCDEARLFTYGAQAGDEIRINYRINVYTNTEEYDSYTIDEVLTEEEARLVDGPDLPITVPSRCEIWHPNTLSEVADGVAEFAGSFSNRRVHVVWPDYAQSGGETVDGMYVACALSGLRSGVQPHQGLTNVEVSGFDSVPRTTTYFGGRQLDTMAESGVWIVTQDQTGTIYTRHQLTTDMSDLNSREDSMVSNMDSLSYTFLFFFRNNRYIGRRNITDGLMAQLSVDFSSLITTMTDTAQDTVLGPQLEDASIISLERDTVNRDKVNAHIQVVLPAPFNNLDIYLEAVSAITA